MLKRQRTLEKNWVWLCPLRLQPVCISGTALLSYREAPDLETVNETGITGVSPGDTTQQSS